MAVRVHLGDSRDVLRAYPDNHFHACVCDPPYALVSIGKRFGSATAAPARPGKSGAYARASAGFMGQRWDTGEVAFDPEFWAEVLRVLRPGAHLLAFGGTRTYHRLACAIEDGGFEIRDLLAWLYGSGFPKSHNQRGPFAGWGTAFKPALEPIAFARKPLEGTVEANLRAYGVGAINIDAGRVGAGRGGARTGEASAVRRYADSGATNFAATPGPRGGDARGRWPANVIHDGSPEVIGAFPDAPGQRGDLAAGGGTRSSKGVYGDMGAPAGSVARHDRGTAARFFYAAKASRAERAGSRHPTIKPKKLMTYLCDLVTPPGGVVLDPFAGSGTTGVACEALGLDAVLIEREGPYVADIHRRLEAAV